MKEIKNEILINNNCFSFVEINYLENKKERGKELNIW